MDKSYSFLELMVIAKETPHIIANRRFSSTKNGLPSHHDTVKIIFSVDGYSFRVMKDSLNNIIPLYKNFYELE